MYVPDRFVLKSSKVQDGMGLYTSRAVKKVRVYKTNLSMRDKVVTSGKNASFINIFTLLIVY